MSSATVINLPVKDKNCPICGKQTIAVYKPFCSSRCCDVDLGRWFNGSYAVETQEMPEPEKLLQATGQAFSDPL